MYVVHVVQAHAIVRPKAHSCSLAHSAVPGASRSTRHMLHTQSSSNNSNMEQQVIYMPPLEEQQVRTQTESVVTAVCCLAMCAFYNPFSLQPRHMQHNTPGSSVCCCNHRSCFWADTGSVAVPALRYRRHIFHQAPQPLVLLSIVIPPPPPPLHAAAHVPYLLSAGPCMYQQHRPLPNPSIRTQSSAARYHPSCKQQHN
jgi:hypothetical protein